MMDTQLENALVAILKKAASGIDFAVEQAPDVVQQLLAWKTAEAAVWVVISIVVLISLKWTVPKCIKSFKDCDNEPWAVAGILHGILATILLLSAVFDSIPTMLKIWLAPKMYIFEYAASLAN